MHQGQLSKEPTAELIQRSLPKSIPGRDQSSQGATIVLPSTSFRENTKMREVMWAHFAKELLVVVGQLTPCAKLQVCSRTAGGFMRHWMPDVHLMWSEGVAHLLNESCRLGSILKPVCGPRVHESRHDGDPSIKKMLTSKKITNVVICHNSSTVPRKKMVVLSPWMPQDTTAAWL